MNAAYGIAAIAIFYLSVLQLLILYLAVTHLQKHWEQLDMTQKVIFSQVGILGLAWDIVVNWILATLFFFDFPRERTLTARLTRYCCRQDLRGKIARWVCTNLLDVFDITGSHCS